VNTLCESEVLAHKISDNPETAHVEEGIRIKPVNVGECAQELFILHAMLIYEDSRMPELEEDGVRIALTVVDTPGFGDNIDNEFAYVFVQESVAKPSHSQCSFQEIVGYLERQYDDILAEESRIKRNPRFRDNRIHALLYFIPPTGHAYATPLFFLYQELIDVHSLREMDIELMRRLSPRVNVIPVIGKADSLTPSELKGFKKRVSHCPLLSYNYS
jgi:cell division control protein 11